MHAIIIWDIFLLLIAIQSHTATADDVIVVSGTNTPEEAVYRFGTLTITLYPVSPGAHSNQIITIKFWFSDKQLNSSWYHYIRLYNGRIVH